MRLVRAFMLVLFVCSFETCLFVLVRHAFRHVLDVGRTFESRVLNFISYYCRFHFLLEYLRLFHIPM